MKIIRNVVLCSLCCVIIVFLVPQLRVLWERAFGDECHPPIDEGISVSEIQYVIKSNADIFAAHEILGLQIEWGHLIFIVSRNDVSSNSYMRLEFDFKRQMSVSPLIESMTGKGLTCLEFVEILEVAQNELKSVP